MRPTAGLSACAQLDGHVKTAATPLGSANPATGSGRTWRLHPVLSAWVAAVTGVAVSMAISVPLDLYQQLGFGLISVIAALLIRRSRWGKLAVIALIVLSLTGSLRYMYWRLGSTLAFDSLLEGVLGWILVGAEMYALTILMLGYLQTAWPLRRSPQPLPADQQQWPSVDIFIPSYNEPLSVVRMTVLAAQAIDWPADKLRIYLLDDGRRDDFKAFCVEAGAGYLTRADNTHAKAGNLNAALGRTDGEFVAVFDCDHIPTRSFLQVTMGSFLQDPKLAMLQTPHHFFSPDPFEKNFKTFHKVPNEADLFYGLVQDGNDLWNAAFFCGSCAVLRRAPLLEVGGVAVETVTEDAHTSLKMSRKGYNLAYLAIPQAAGLATESLSAHIGQRIRWARGMAQIFRIDNPLLGPGLSLGQRLCYVNAMLHFFYGLPRLVFLTSPLAYLFFSAQVFQASGTMVLAYALPHILLSIITNSRIQGKFRHSFWNEVYETVLAWYITWPVLLALISPKLGIFKVTAKGGIVRKSYYDWRMGLPYLVLLGLNLLGLGAGAIRLASGSAPGATVAINLVWCLYNIIIISASILVAREARQLRSTPRVAAVLPATVMWPNGRTTVCETLDFSSSGVGLKVSDQTKFNIGAEIQIAISRGDIETVLTGVVAQLGENLGIDFKHLSIAQQRELALITFSRADNWTGTWGKTKLDAPFSALRDLLVFGLMNLFSLTVRSALVWPRKLGRQTGSVRIKTP